MVLFLIAILTTFVIPQTAAQNNQLGANGKIAFVTDRDGNQEIYVMESDGSGQTRLTNNNSQDGGPEWSPDGTKIVYWRYFDDNWEIWVMNADGSNQKMLTDNSDGYPSWSPDGDKIVFTSWRNYNAEIYVMNADGSGQTRLTNNSYEDGAPSWSPNGDKIVFDTNRNGARDIYVMNVDGSGQTRLTNNAAEDYNPSWSPDGSKIVFDTNRDGNYELYSMNSDGSAQTRLTNTAADDGYPHYAPDGAKIVFDTNRDDNWEIYTINAEGSGATRITFNDFVDWDPAWQRMDKQTATLTLQSTTTNTVTDASFELSATLSAQKSGKATLYWSVNDSGFTYQHEETITNGEFTRGFSCSIPGTWVFKLIWGGDDDYASTESNTITVNVNPAPTQNLETSANPTEVYTGGVTTIKIKITSGGSAVTGAQLTPSSSSTGTFSAITDHNNGTYTFTFTSSDSAEAQTAVINIQASKDGYAETQSQVQVKILPLTIIIVIKSGDGTPISNVTVSSASQPSGQGTLSRMTDADGRIIFDNISKGSYSFKATKTGYAEKSWTTTVETGKATSEAITLTKASEGIPAYPILSITLAIIAVTFFYHQSAHTPRARNKR